MVEDGGRSGGWGSWWVGGICEEGEGSCEEEGGGGGGEEDCHCYLDGGMLGCAFRIEACSEMIREYSQVFGNF